MIEYVDTITLKKKIGKLISKLYSEAHIQLSNITDRLITSDLLDMLEENRIEEFLKMSYEEMAFKLFGCELMDESDIVTELYWSGMQYVNIALNLRIPIKQVLLLLPIDEMSQKFEIYHEMHERALIEWFEQNAYGRSILKILRKQSCLTVKELSFLTDIPEPSLKAYESDNEKLFNASFKAVDSIKKALGVSWPLLWQKSQLVPYTRNLWDDTEFLKAFRAELELNDEVQIFNGYVSKGELKAAELLAKNVIVVNDVASWIYASPRGVLQKPIDSKKVVKAISNAIDEVLAKYKEKKEGLYF